MKGCTSFINQRIDIQRESDLLKKIINKMTKNRTPKIINQAMKRKEELMMKNKMKQLKSLKKL